MLPCRTAINRAVEVPDSDITAPQEYLRIGDVCPLCSLHFLGWGLFSKWRLMSS
jgi:hypothetical protein